ncbi:MAG: LLM class flavin-dependent oxidoreductase [Nitrososphaerales archaeon]
MRIAIGFNADVPVREILNYATESEELGYHSIWMHEHSFGRDALSFLSSVAPFTSKIKLGAGCLNPYTRHPIVLAQSMSTLQETSHGRAILGIGSGFPMRLDLLGIRHEKPIGAIKETIEICRTLWDGNELECDGSNFSLKNVKSLMGAISSKIPIYVAGWKKQMLAITGKHADGYVAKGGESTASIKNIVASIAYSAEKNRRKLADIDVSAYLLTLVAGSKREALEGARRNPFVNYMLSVQDDYLYEGTGIDPKKKKSIAENYFKGRLAESASYVTDEMLEAFTLVGTREEICERIVEYRKAGVNLPILQPISTKPQEVMSVMVAGSNLIKEPLARV